MGGQEDRIEKKFWRNPRRTSGGTGREGQPARVRHGQHVVLTDHFQ